jgi:hypothetical protein
VEGQLRETLFTKGVRLRTRAALQPRAAKNAGWSEPIREPSLSDARTTSLCSHCLAGLLVQMLLTGLLLGKGPASSAQLLSPPGDLGCELRT